MSAWRRVALETLPEFRKVIEAADSPMALWVDLILPLRDAVAARNDERIRRFFRYAEWCYDTARDRGATDASTAAWCAFYEDIPRVPGLVEQLHRFLPRTRFIQVLDAFRYHTTEEQFNSLRDTYLHNAKLI